MDTSWEAEAIDEDFGQGNGMDFADNPLYQSSALFTPASQAQGRYPGSSRFGNATAAFGSEITFAGSPAYSSAFPSAQPASRDTGAGRPSLFDPDPRLFDHSAAALDDQRDSVSVPFGEAPPIAANALTFPAEVNESSSHGRKGSPEDIEFADVLGQLMRGETSPPEAVRDYAAICRARAAELRTQAASQLQRAARYMALRDEANALEDEAATWLLLAHLGGNNDPRFPGGYGGPGGEASADALRQSIHQQAADVIAEDSGINRAARVVAWLEALAAEALDAEAALSAAGGGTVGRFGVREGVWAETRLRLAAGLGHQGGQPLVSELDPDAPGRQRRPLHPENVADEERLMARLWRLIRAGRVAEACELCRECGQPWRAASLSGGGEWGPTPLGDAATAADAPENALQLAEEVADQVTRGDVEPRALWRWAAFQVSEKAAAASQPGRHGPSAGTLEAAIYGVLAGNLAAVMPACSSWEDVTWALLRCWLEATLDRQLLQGGQQGREETDTGLDVDLLAAALPSHEGVDMAALREGLSVATGGWPLPRLLARLPKEWTDVFTDEGAAEAAPVRAQLHRHQRSIQAALILQQLQRCAERLATWVLPQDGASGGKGAPRRDPGAMRFAAHFALALRATRLVAEPTWDEEQLDPVQEALNKVLQAYVVHAIEADATWLVPQLACHLRAGRRHLTYSIFAETLTARSMAECETAFAEADAWFTSWQGGDVQPDEMLIIANQFVAGSRQSPAGGPAFRAQAARWLCFSDDSVGGALAHAASLARELTLGLVAAPAPSAAAGWALLHEVLPAGRPRRVLEASDEQLAEMELSSDVADLATEVRVWAAVFEQERRFQEWQEAHASAVEGRVTAPTAEEAAPLRRAAEDVATSLLAFLQGGDFQRVLDQLAETEEMEEGFEASLTAVPAGLIEPDSEASAEALTCGRAYPVLTAADAAAAADVVQSSLQAALAASPSSAGLRATAAAGNDNAAGLLDITISGTSSEAASVAAAAVAAVVKGALPGDAPSAGSLWAINFNGSATLAAQAAWRIVAPRLALQAAEARQVAVSLGSLAELAADLPLLVAGVPSQPGSSSAGLAPLFSAAELQEFLDAERATALFALHNQEAESAQSASEVATATGAAADADGFELV